MSEPTYEPQPGDFISEPNYVHPQEILEVFFNGRVRMRTDRTILAYSPTVLVRLHKDTTLLYRPEAGEFI